MIEESAYDELDRYVHGKMSGEELKGFLQKLDSDHALRGETEWIRSTMIAMSVSGRLVMKQHIAASMTGGLEKYTPSKNKKSFWKKWWWAFVTVTVAVAVAVTVNRMWPALEQESGEHGKDEMPRGGGGSPVEMQSLDSAVVADSCASVDSLLKSMEKVDSSVVDTVSVEIGLWGEQEPELYFDIDDAGQVNQIALTGSNTYCWNAGAGKELAMRVTLNIRKAHPFTYELDSALTLNSDYRCAKNLKFTGSGDTVIMTDSLNNNYVLLRNAGKRQLVKRPSGTQGRD